MPESQQSQKGQQIILNKILSNLQRKVLDIGGGLGKWGKHLTGKMTQVDTVEIWKPYIEQYQLSKYYDTVYNCDIQQFPFGEIVYDIAILGDVLEHIQYENAVVLIKTMKQFFSFIYLIIPINVCTQHGRDGNPYEAHVYQWVDKEIRNILGFSLLNVSVNDNGLVAIGAYEWKRNANI